MQLKTVGDVLEHLRSGVFVRLQRSEHGIGVFAICTIPAGIDPFQERSLDLSFLSVPVTMVLDDPAINDGVKRLVRDMCAARGGFFNFPRCGLNAVAPLFYLNHSTNPNVGIGGEVFFKTLREISAGEELTVDYGTYCDELDLT